MHLGNKKIPRVFWSCLGAWIRKDLVCEVIEFERFALGLPRDFRAVSAGLRLAWSNWAAPFF